MGSFFFFNNSGTYLSADFFPQSGRDFFYLFEKGAAKLQKKEGVNKTGLA